MSRVLVRDLEIQHPEYKALSPYWRTIRDLKEGVIAITKNLTKYLPKRPDEDDELYRLRLNKFSYTPVMGDAVAKYAAKLAGSPVHLSNADDPFWQEFRSNNNNPDAAPRKESKLLNELFTSMLYYARVWVVGDRPDLGVQPRSLYESMGLNNRPFVQLYEPLEVPYWGTDWAIVKHYYPLVAPFQAPKTICRWCYHNTTTVVPYEAEVKLKTVVDSEGNKYNTLDRVLIGDRWLPWDDAEAVLEPVPNKTWQHNLGVRLVTTMELPSESWVCKNVFNKQIQHLRIENAWTDAGYLSGTVQRIFTPPDASPMDDPRVVYEQPNYAQELSRAGNTHILIGKGYSFVESTGSALGNLQGQLEKIESQIKQLVSLHFASVATSALSQSGASKAVDMSLLEDSMKDYGQQVLSLYNSILKIIARMVGLPEPTAVGLSNYSVNNTDDLISQLMGVEELPTVPMTAKKIAYGKLAQLLVGTASPEDEEKIKKELEEMFTDKPESALSSSQEELYSLTQEEVDYILGGS